MEIKKAKTTADFAAARRLIDIMAEWDEAETRAQGFSADKLIPELYSQTPDDLRAKFSAADAAFLIAWDDGQPAGCVAYSRLDGNMAEINKMFVDPDHRGRGCARALMTAALDGVTRAGFSEVGLETVTFMKEAIALYRSFGFEPCEPFHYVIEELKPITVFFRRTV
jgi:GNAT superfamily N-acetyltransferase